MLEQRTVSRSIELLESFLSNSSPLDSLMAKFFRSNKQIGSKDRQSIASLTYDVIRIYQELVFRNRKITNEKPRFMMITFLVIKRGMDLKKMDVLFNGKQELSKLSDFEKSFINKLLNDDIQLPDYVSLNYPEWMDALLHKAFPINFREELAALNARAPLDIRVNSLKTDVESVLKVLQQEGYPAHTTELSSDCIRIDHKRLSKAHPLLQDGLVEIQDEGSQLIAQFCNVKPGDAVVDFCAGAGGKTLALAAKMQNKGRIYATDKHEYRLENAKLRLRKAGVTNTYCNAVTNKWIKRHMEFADCVLVDAPCSGSGTWRRNPDMKIRLKENDIVELTQLQQEILSSASKLVKPTGLLIYSTCSVFCQENEEQVDTFLKNHPEFCLDQILFENKKLDYVKTSPCRNKTDGFFCARFIKKGEK